jgi:hypothetical protein
MATLETDEAISLFLSFFLVLSALTLPRTTVKLETFEVRLVARIAS